MTRARPLLDPFAQGRTPSAPCTLAPLLLVTQYQGWRCKQLCRSCLAGVRPDHRRSCDREFLPMPFRQLGALSQSGALLCIMCADWHRILRDGIDVHCTSARLSLFLDDAIAACGFLARYTSLPPFPPKQRDQQEPDNRSPQHRDRRDE
jgi:hypothetical protein